jgi:hypothetical protein
MLEFLIVAGIGAAAYAVIMAVATFAISKLKRPAKIVETRAVPAH